jgi:hypothetical protein
MTLVAQKVALSALRLLHSVHEVFLDSRALKDLGFRAEILAGDALVKEYGRASRFAPWRIAALPLSGQPRFQRYLGLRGVITRSGASGPILSDKAACKVICCTTMPPIEKPNRSTCFRPSVLMKAMASAAIRSNVAAGDARVVEQDHLPVASQAIRHRRVQ